MGVIVPVGVDVLGVIVPVGVDVLGVIVPVTVTVGVKVIVGVTVRVVLGRGVLVRVGKPVRVGVGVMVVVGEIVNCAARVRTTSESGDGELTKSIASCTRERTAFCRERNTGADARPGISHSTNCSSLKLKNPTRFGSPNLITKGT